MGDLNQIATELEQGSQDLIGEPSTDENLEGMDNEAVEGEEQEHAVEGEEQELEGQEGQGGQEEPEEQGKLSEPGDKDEYINNLKSEIDTLKSQLELLLKMQKGEDISSESKTEPESERPKVDIDVTVDEDTYDKILESPESFARWAKDFASKIADRTLEAVYQNVPELIRKYADETVTVRTYAQQFYRDNPDLEPYKTEVARIANVIAQAEPNLPYDKFFKKVADYARYFLGLYKKTEESQQQRQKRGGKPALPNKPMGGRRKPETIEGMEKEILDLINSL